MNFDTVVLWQGTDKAELPVKLICSCPDDFLRPAVLVLPGGAYMCYGSRERENVAQKFNNLGFHAFVLEYSIAPSRYPQPQQDVWRALRYIRRNAERYRVIPDKIAVCGFSAGGHLAASSAVLPEIADGTSDLDGDCRPNAVILGYPVISMTPDIGHMGSFSCLTGIPEDAPECELMHYLSLENHVSAVTPPVFVWTIADDAGVDPENSLRFAKALWKNRVACQLEIYNHGIHGTGLSEEYRDIAQWPEQAAVFLRSNCGF